MKPPPLTDQQLIAGLTEQNERLRVQLTKALEENILLREEAHRTVPSRES